MLRAQIAAGLNAGLSGIGWWTTDIGGFYDGDPDCPAFRELLIRWFQWATFSPVLRLHGFRSSAGKDAPQDGDAPRGSHEEFAIVGADNELWSFGDDVYAILARYLSIREKIRPYLREVLAEYSRTGIPPMRAMFLEFGDDPRMWNVADQYMLGADLLIAPVLEPGQTRRTIVVPATGEWRDGWTGDVVPSGGEITVDCPIDRIPFLTRNGMILSDA